VADVTASHAPLAWLSDYADKMRSLFGEDFWPYGIEPNRPTLEAFLQFASEQGVCHRRLAVAELSPAQFRHFTRLGPLGISDGPLFRRMRRCPYF
jgi:4,5-dihydroxyphthalate decarboxylase